MSKFAPDTRNVIMDGAYMAQKVCAVIHDELAHNALITPNLNFESIHEREVWEHGRRAKLNRLVNDALVRLDAQFPEYSIRSHTDSTGSIRFEVFGPVSANVSFAINSSGTVYYFNVYRVGTGGHKYDLWTAPVEGPFCGMSPFSITACLVNA